MKTQKRTYLKLYAVSILSCLSALIAIFTIIIPFLNIWQNGNFISFCASAFSSGESEKILVVAVIFFLIAFSLYILIINIGIVFDFILIFKCKYNFENFQDLDKYNEEVRDVARSIHANAMGTSFLILTFIIYILLSFVLAINNNTTINLEHIKLPIKLYINFAFTQFILSFITLLFLKKKTLDKFTIQYNLIIVIMSLILLSMITNTENFAISISALESTPKNFSLLLFGEPNSQTSIFGLTKNLVFNTNFNITGDYAKWVAYLPLFFIFVCIKDIFFRLFAMLSYCSKNDIKKETNPNEKLTDINIALPKLHGLWYIVPMAAYFVLNYLASGTEESLNETLSFSPYLVVSIFAVGIISLILSNVMRKRRAIAFASTETRKKDENNKNENEEQSI